MSINQFSGKPLLSLSCFAFFAAAVVSAAPASGAAIFSNTIYQAQVNGPSENASFGSWAAATDASHPVGGGKDIMYIEVAGFINPGTNFSSLRVYNSAGGGVADYTFFGNGGGIDLDPLFLTESASPFGTFGTRSTWGVTSEGLDITQDVVITGGAFSNSAIYHTVEILNSGTTTRDIGWRNLYDWLVDDPTTDDGPNNSIETTTTTPVGATTFEFSHTPGAGEFARVSIDLGVASYEPLLALGFDPGFIPALPVTLPDEYAYVSWPGSATTAFDYTVTPTLDVTSDSAGLSWFGRDAGRAITLDPGTSVRLTQVLFGVAPGQLPPGQQPPTAVPEPGTLAIFGLGLAGLGYMRRRRAA